MKITIPLLTIIVSILIPRIAHSENPWQKREVLVYTPVWKVPGRVPSFIQDKAEKVLLKEKGKYGWIFKQVGYIPLVLRSNLDRADENYLFHLKLTDRTGKELCSVKGNCDACTTSEAIEALAELRVKLIEKMEPLFKQGNVLWKKEQAKKEQADLDKKLAAAKAREAKLKKELARLNTPVTKYKAGEPRKMAIPRYDRPTPPKKLWFYVLGGIAATSLVAGIYLLSINSDLTCDGGYSEECRERYATATAGYTFTFTGLAVGGLAGYLFYNIYMSDSATPKVQVTPAVTKSTAGVSLTFRF